MHIGLIGGIGPAATEYYYRGLARAHAAAGRPMELTIVHAQLSDLIRTVTTGEATAQAEIFAALVARLQAAGAECAAVSSLGGHFCIDELAAVSPLPLTNLITALDAAVADRELSRVGLLGTRVVMESGVYGGLTSAETVAPRGAEFDAVAEAYIAMAMAGRATAEQRDLFFTIGEKLVREQGAEAVVLGGTDLFLAFDGHDCGFPVLDSADVHIEALYRASVAGMRAEA
jgi:aspartate racemase